MKGRDLEDVIREAQRFREAQREVPGHSTEGKAGLALGWMFMIGVVGGAVCFLYLVDRFCNVWNMSSPRVSQYLDAPLDVPMVEGREVRLHGPRESGLLVVFGKAVVFRPMRLPNRSTVLMRRSASTKEVRFVLADYLRTPSGRWRATKASVRSSGALEGRFAGVPGQRTEEWGGSLKSRMVTIAPFLDVSLPLDRVSLEAPLDRRRVDLHVELELDLPSPVSSTRFRNESARVKHDLSIIVLSEEEAAAYKRARRRYRFVEGGKVFLQGLVVLLVALPLVVVPRRIASKKGLTLRIE